MRTFGHRSRTPHGVRELKLADAVGGEVDGSRTPHGVRELKHPQGLTHLVAMASHPTRGA